MAQAAAKLEPRGTTPTVGGAADSGAAAVPWSKSADEAALDLGADARSGLATREVAGRIERFGHTRIRDAARRSAAAMLLGQFSSIVVWLLIVAGM